MELTDLVWPRTTERLVLRPLREADVEAVYAYRSLPTTYEWIGRAPGSPAEFSERALRTAAAPGVLALVVERDDALVGDCFLELADAWAQDDLAEAKRSQAELGYIIDPAYAGRGFATEVARELVRIGFADLGLRRLTAGCFADNHASRRVLEKAGLRLEGLSREDSLHRDRGWLDGCQFAMLATEWAG